MTDSWIQTFSGRRFWPLNPRIEEVCIEDIAHALAMKCRFSGHSRDFYSVAQHSVIGSLHCEEPKWFLLHDSAEAYLPDIARPIKKSVTGFGEIEDRLLSIIAARFGLFDHIPVCVKDTDIVMLATERRDLMNPCEILWDSINGITPLSMKIEPWTWQKSEHEFLQRFRVLFSK